MNIFILEHDNTEMNVNQDVERYYSKDGVLYLEKGDQTDGIPHTNIKRFIIKA